MTALNKFLEPIEIAGKPLDKKFQAYRMDGTSPKPNMRQEAKLGTCECCDYFKFDDDDTIVLIEETQLMKKIKDLKSKYYYLEDRHQTEFVKKQIKDENKLKVYGAMLVLCRLAAVCENVKDLLQTKNGKLKKYKFWLVASGMDTEEATRMFDHLKGQLRKELRSTLKDKILGRVEILPSHAFVTKLSEQATTP